MRRQAMSQKSEGGGKHSEDDDAYSSDGFEQELPGESSTLPLQQQADHSLQQPFPTTLLESGATRDQAATETHLDSSENNQPQIYEKYAPDADADTPTGVVAEPQQQHNFTAEDDEAPTAVLLPAPADEEPQRAEQASSNSKLQQNEPQRQLGDQSPHSEAEAHELPATVFVQSLNSPQAVVWGHTAAAPSSSSPTTAVVSPPPPAGRPSYADLSLRCQALENALEQQQQHSAALQQALAAAHAAHAEEEASMRQYYEAQLADRQQELQLLMDRLAAQQQQTAVMVAGAADDGTALSVDHRHAAAAGGGDGGTANTIRTASPWSDQHHHHRQHSPSSMSPRPLSRSQQQQRSGVLSSSINSAIAAAAGSGVFSLGDVVVLRRELAQAEQLLTGYQAENAAAARRIKDLESQLTAVRSSLADEAARAQRAAAAAAEAQRVSGAAAADRLSRQLHLEGLLQQQTADWSERERQLMNVIDELRRDKAAAEARAAAAVQGVDMTTWQAEDEVIAELRDQLSAQSAAHQQQLSELQSKLSWYVENQQLISQSDELVTHQAQVIRQLENRLQQVEGTAAAGGGTAGARRQAAAAAARISELEQQVHDLKQLLTARHPSSLPAAALAAAGPGESSALAAAQTTIRQLEQQLDLQQQQHDHGLRSLQQQYEALKIRMEQRQAKEEASGSWRNRLRDLTQQLEDQRLMYTRKIRALEAKVTAAEGAAAAAARRRASAAGAGSSSSNRAPGRVGLRAAGKSGPTGTAAVTAGKQGRQHAAAAAGSDVSSSGAEGDQHAAADDHVSDHDADMQQQQSSSPDTAAAAAAAAASGVVAAESHAVVLSGLLRVKQRQLAGLTAQLEERTTQFLQLQQKLRAAERQIKQLTAASRETAASPGAGTDDSADDEGKTASRAVTTGVGQSTQRESAGNAAAAAAAASDTGAAAASWPALCAELEQEVDALKAELFDTQQRLAAAQQQVADRLHSSAASDHHHQQQQQQQDRASSAPPIPLLVSVAEEAASRAAAVWRDKVRWLEEALQNSQLEVSTLKLELKQCRAQGKWTPTAAAFEALEKKINSLEAAQRQKAEYQQQQQSLQLAELQLVVQRYEQLLAVRDAELQGFRAQVDALLSTAKQLQAAA